MNGEIFRDSNGFGVSYRDDYDGTTTARAETKLLLCAYMVLQYYSITHLYLKVVYHIHPS